MVKFDDLDEDEIWVEPAPVNVQELPSARANGQAIPRAAKADRKVVVRKKETIVQPAVKKVSLVRPRYDSQETL